MWIAQKSKRDNEREQYGLTNGLGWHIPNYPQRKVVCRNDSIKGFAANITPFTDRKITVILLCNLENIDKPNAIAKAIAEHFIPDLAQEPLKPPLYNS